MVLSKEKEITDGGPRGFAGDVVPTLSASDG